MREDIRYFAEEKGAPFVIELSGRSWCDGTYRIQRTNPKVWVLEYVLSGRGTIRLSDGGEREYHPETGDVYLLPTGIEHLYYSDAQEPWNKLFINCKGAVVERLADAYGLSERILFSGMQEAESLFWEMYALMEDKTLDDAVVLERTEIIVHEIFRKLGLRYREREQAGRETEEIRKVRQYLDTHVGQIVTIEELTKLIYRSPDYLIKHFKAQTGVTPYQYLLKRKMQIAERLLKDTVLPVKAVAEQLGYTDAHYFSGLFRKENGVSPLQFRKNVHKGS